MSTEIVGVRGAPTISFDSPCKTGYSPIMAFPAREILTAHDLDAFPEDGNRYEILEGELLVSPAPFLRHQRLVMNLAYAIERLIQQGRLKGRVFPAPVKVVLSNFTRFEPDVVFVAEKNFPILKRDGIYGAPDLVIEVLSADVQRDRNVKLPAYLEFVVKEVWLVDGEQNSLEVFTSKGPPACAQTIRDSAELYSPTVQGLVLSMPELFRD